MKRRDLFKTLGSVGLAAGLNPVSRVLAGQPEPNRPGKAGCWLTTATTAGPYYFDPHLLRQDIRTDSDTGEFHGGAPLEMALTVINADCQPIPGVLVDVWHCDKDGIYSGYVQPSGNFVGQDFMRGTQVTDNAGRVSFLTSYPGWYPGRATHIHFKVRLDAFSYVTSQWAFDETVSDAIHVTPDYVSRGICTTRNANDGVFRNLNLEHLTMEVAPSGEGDGYEGQFTIGIEAESTSGVDNPNLPASLLEQNYPNPFNPRTNIRYTLPEASAVDLRVYDARGTEVAVLERGLRGAGPHEVSFDGTGLPSGFYFYRLVAGEVTDSRQMLLIK